MKGQVVNLLECWAIVPMLRLHSLVTEVWGPPQSGQEWDVGLCSSKSVYGLQMLAFMSYTLHVLCQYYFSEHF